MSLLAICVNEYRCAMVICDPGPWCSNFLDVYERPLPACLTEAPVRRTEDGKDPVPEGQPIKEGRSSVQDLGDFEGRIATLDCDLFSLIETQSTEKDRRSWLALQRAVRDAKAPFVYLEIGSYLGGSLQQYLQDPKCSRIYSIDNRTTDRRHSVNSTQTMLENLSTVAPEEMHKLVCFDADARDLPPGSVSDVVDACFIDGKHTNEAVLSDFAFCLSVCAPDAVIYFHDAGCTRAGITACLRRLKRSARPFVAYKLPGDTFVVALRDSPVRSDPRVRRMAVAANGERWLVTAAVSKRARRWAPAALRPAFARMRDRWWGTLRQSR